MNAGTAAGASSGGVVNVNTASLELLTTLPGIGPKTVETLALLVKVRD